MIRKKISKLSRIKSKTYEILTESTSHGLPNIFKTERNCIKIMWLILFLASSSLSVILVTKSIFDYLNFDVVTIIDVKYEMPTEFPAVTFYNLKNPTTNRTLKDILMRCRFNNKICSESDFDTLRDRFNIVSYRFKKKLTYVAGKLYGLQMLLYFPNISTSYSLQEGYSLLIHNHSISSGMNGIFTNEGIDISPGFYTNIIINRIFASKLEEPYNKCIKDVSSVNSFNSELYRYIVDKTNYTYRQKDCFDFCIGRELFKYLNISNATDSWAVAFLTATKGAKMSETLFAELLKIHINFTQSKMNEICVPECPLECDTIRYEKSLSFSKLSPLALNFSNNFGESLTLKELQDSLMFINIYYDDLTYTSISQTEEIDIFGFISNLGGILGLFIGISFLSFAEIFELILEILFILFEKK